VGEAVEITYDKYYLGSWFNDKVSSIINLGGNHIVKTYEHAHYDGEEHTYMLKSTDTGNATIKNLRNFENKISSVKIKNYIPNGVYLHDKDQYGDVMKLNLGINSYVGNAYNDRFDHYEIRNPSYDRYGISLYQHAYLRGINHYYSSANRVIKLDSDLVNQVSSAYVYSSLF
jgi:hypothetical protein